MNLWGRQNRDDDRDDREAAQVQVGDAIVDELSNLRDVPTPPALVASVMGKIEARPAPSLWTLLHRPLPIVLRVSPLGLVALAAVAVAGVVLLRATQRFQPIPMTIATESPPSSSSPAPEPTPATIVTPRPEPTATSVLVRFALRDRKARRVTVAGSWNGWNRTDTVLTSTTSDGLHTAVVPLPPGEHQYMFVVDGKFVTDPDATDYRPDGFGNRNAVLRL